MRIAVASRDGETVSGHIGKCSKWIIFDVTEVVLPGIWSLVDCFKPSVKNHYMLICPLSNGLKGWNQRDFVM